MWPLPLRRLAMYYLEHPGTPWFCFSTQRHEESKLNYLKKLLDHNNVICSVISNISAFLPDNENAGGSAICIHGDLLPEEAIVTHLITCHGRDHLVNIRSERHSLVIVNVHSEPELTLRQLRGRLKLIHPHWPAYPAVWGFSSSISTFVTQKKDDLTSGTRSSPMATRERLLCSNRSSHTSLRLLNLITPGEMSGPLVTFVLFQGLIGFLLIYLWLKHVISTAHLMLLRIS